VAHDPGPGKRRARPRAPTTVFRTGRLGTVRSPAGEDFDDEGVPIREAQAVDSPRAGALLIGLVSRMGSLESQVRQERLQRLSTQERFDVQVLDNEEATALIRDLEAKLAEADRQLETLVQIREAAFGVINLVESEGDDFIAAGSGKTALLGLLQRLRASFGA